MNRFYCILLFGGDTGFSSYFCFRGKIWTDSYDCLCWIMLSHGLDYGIEYVSYFFNAQMYHELINITNLSSNSMMILVFAYIGYECQSSRNSFETYIWREESIYLLSNMVLYYNCHRMLSYANQLLEQGMYCWVSTHHVVFYCYASYLIRKTMIAGFRYLQHYCHITGLLRHVYHINHHRQHNHV